MLTIRLTRKGKKNQPFFRVIVIDKRRTAKGGNAVEVLGNVDPLTKKRNFKKDRILYWISKGAKPSPSVHNLLVSEKIIDAKKINVSKKPKKSAEEVKTPAPAAAVASPEAPVAAPAEVSVSAPGSNPVEIKTSMPEVAVAEQKPEEPRLEAEKPAEPEKPAEEAKPEEIKVEEAKPEESKA